ncbi:lactonase family protein [Bacillus salipaludis]|uniref:Lactonase family protein n=1 Tax=Bacillus salipaludis TaxID=2547811 RepID=A0A4V3AU00_9BACI|nr:lactonase family protein [Bacillus salipaludis]MDQ6600106.1 lactonase family protein [Bacillus salipaludis]TDK62426.1 lactonase family protein [Bacillus salipaludis]
MISKSEYTGYIGTYTKGDSKGIYTFKLDTENEKITDIKAVAELDNPTYLNISQDNRYLYAVIKKGEEGGVASFSLDSESGELTPMNTQLAPGSSPCHVSMDSKNQYLFSANYHKGTVESYLLDSETGFIQQPASVIQHEGSGPDPRQEKAHTHFAGITPDEKYIVVVELGTDLLLTYEVNIDGELTEVSRLSTPAGNGPRHITFHPNGKFAYVMTEFSSEVIFLTYHAEDGHFIANQFISTLPDDFKENNQGSAIHISADGRFVYAGNRGHNSIAVFSVDETTGELSFVYRVSSEGDWPRDFSIDPTGRYMVGSNQESGNLVLYRRDVETGKLTLIERNIEVPFPVCVKFLHY